MPGGGRVRRKKSDGTLLKVYGKPEGITLGELQRGAKNVLRFVMASTAMEILSFPQSPPANTPGILVINVSGS